MSKRRWMMGAAGAVAMGTAGLCTGAFSVWGAWFSPAAEENIAVVCGADVPLLPRGKRIRTLVWNVQYAGGRDRHFFYDGGDDVSVTEGEVRDTLQGIAEVIRRVDTDIILWQEIDRGSRRTGFIGQNQALLDAGQELNVRPVGSRALMSLRLEKGYGSWGREYSPEYWPQEVGLDRLIKLDKEEEFLGKQAYIGLKDRAPREKLVILSVANSFG